MDRNAKKKQGKMQLFFPYAILVFQIFWQKNFLYIGLRLVRSSKEKRSPLFCSVEEWSEIV